MDLHIATVLLLVVACSSTPVINMNGEVATFVKEAIKKDPVVIFSKSYCPYCKGVKELFNRIHQNFTAIELDKRNDGDTIQDVLREMTGARSVPRVFVNGTFIGGAGDIHALDKSGKLQNILPTPVVTAN